MTIAAIHRYPVKSMQGEALQRATLDERGVVGDRAYALLDVETGIVASAKVPKRWDQLLRFSAGSSFGIEGVYTPFCKDGNQREAAVFTFSESRCCPRNINGSFRLRFDLYEMKSSAPWTRPGREYNPSSSSFKRWKCYFCRIN